MGDLLYILNFRRFDAVTAALSRSVFISDSGCSILRLKSSLELATRT